MKLKSILFCSAFLFTAFSAHAFPSIYPTGTTILDPDKAYGGYALMGSPMGTVKYIVNLNGEVVHSWQNAPGDRARLLPNGNLLTLVQWQKKVIEYDWDGNVVWEYTTNRGPHHDVHRLANGNTLILCFEDVPVEKLDQVKNYTDKWYGELKREGVLLKGDSIIEVTPDKQIAWEWNSSDHLDLNQFMPLVPLNDWTHGNTIQIIPENKWYDAGDKRFKPGNILYNPRHFDEIQVIDKESGNIVAKISTKEEKGFSNGHEPTMVPKGIAGEGNVLFFDNGLLPKTMRHAHSTYLYEIDPITNETVWKYSSRWKSGALFSSVAGSIAKLPNGNILVSEDNGGRTLQIKPSEKEGGEIVWEYQAQVNAARSSFYDYDYCPQLKAMPVPEVKRVSPLPLGEFKVLPDEERKDGNVTAIIAK